MHKGFQVKNEEETEEKTHEAISSPFPPNKVPLIVHIASRNFSIRPQYRDTPLKWIMALLQKVCPDLPDHGDPDNELYLLNWTKGKRIGDLVSEETTLE